MANDRRIPGNPGTLAPSATPHETDPTPSPSATPSTTTGSTGRLVNDGGNSG